MLYCKHPKIRPIWDAYLTMERIQINASAAKLRGTVAVLKIYRCNKREGGKRTMDDKGERGHGCNKGEREQEPWMIKERENMDVTKEGVSAKVTPLSRLWNREGLCGLLQDGNRRGEDMNSLSHDSYRRQEA